MRLKKSRRKFLFSEKFQKDIFSNEEKNELIKKIQEITDKKVKSIIRNERRRRKNEIVKEFLLESELYKGCFFIKRKEFNKKLNWNISQYSENYINLENEEYIKVFVSGFDGLDIVATFSLNDPFCEYITYNLPIKDFYLQNNILIN